MSIGYYPGCSLHGTAREFDESFQAIAPLLDVELVEIEDWSCCGASSAHTTNHLLGIALPARNLALAEEQGHDAVVAPCAECYSRLAIARNEIADDASLARQIPDIIERPLANSVDVLNVVQLLLERAEKISELVSADAVPAPLRQLKVAAYYGCLLVRPVGLEGTDDPEVPTTMESVISACGVTPVKWNMAVECCGGSLSMSRTSSVLRLGRAVIEDAKKSGADAIVVACPMCHSNLDFRQIAYTEKGEALPVLYLTQLVGLALGIEPETLGLNRHFIDTRPLLGELENRERVAQAAAAAKAAARDGAVA